MKKKTKIMLVAALSCSFLLGNAIGASAANGLTAITAYLNTALKVKLNMNGALSDFTPKEEDGTYVVPISYNGRTYLPVRFVAEALGTTVTYDQSTDTVYVGGQNGTNGTTTKDTPTATNNTPAKDNGSSTVANNTTERITDKMVEESNLYVEKTRDVDILTTPGKIFEWGFTGKTQGYAGTALTIPVDTELYSRFKAQIWVDGSNVDKENDKIQITDQDDHYVKNIPVKAGKLYEVDINLAGLKKLAIWVPGDTSIIGEPVFVK